MKGGNRNNVRMVKYFTIEFLFIFSLLKLKSKLLQTLYKI